VVTLPEGEKKKPSLTALPLFCTAAAGVEQLVKSSPGLPARSAPCCLAVFTLPSLGTLYKARVRSSCSRCGSPEVASDTAS